MASVNTGNGMRDDDLRSGDFFGIEQHPAASTALSEVLVRASLGRRSPPPAAAGVPVVL
jgi:hypothetical protein